MTKKWAEHYWHSVPCMKARIEEIVRRVDINCSVLEVGCNEGFLSQALIEKGIKVISVDNNIPHIEKAKELFDIEVINADVNKLPFDDNSFDIVIGGELLEHLPNSGKGLSELMRVSRGHVIISLPVGEYWMGEKTHLWEITGCCVEHDEGKLIELKKNFIILEFRKKRTLPFEGAKKEEG